MAIASTREGPIESESRLGLTDELTLELERPSAGGRVLGSSRVGVLREAYAVRHEVGRALTLSQPDESSPVK